MANDSTAGAWIWVHNDAEKQFVGRHSSEGGFTLIELLAAVVVMTIGCSPDATFATTIRATESAQENLSRAQGSMPWKHLHCPQQPARALRGHQQLANGGIFLSGAQPLLCAGPDGIVGTADDVPVCSDTGIACRGVECLVLPGPTVFWHPDDVTTAEQFHRTITFLRVLPSGAVNTNSSP